MKIVFTFLLTTIAAYLAIAFGWVFYADAAHVADNDGGIGMAVIFVFAPLGAVLAGVVAALIVGRSRAVFGIKVALGVIGLLLLARALLAVVGL